MHTWLLQSYRAAPIIHSVIHNIHRHTQLNAVQRTQRTASELGRHVCRGPGGCLVGSAPGGGGIARPYAGVVLTHAFVVLASRSIRGG